MTTLSTLIDETPYYRFLGLRAGPDGSVVLPAGEHHASDRAVIHGGVLSAFLEACGVLHLRTTGAPRASTADMTAAFLRPAQLVDTAARVQIIRRGRRFAHLQVSAWQSDPASPVAVGYGTWLLEP
jgi:acyl-coenzyme A thioesterase PaaI-like protein